MRDSHPPKALADTVETVLVCLPTPDIVREVALGADGLVQGDRIKTYIDLSTTGPRTSMPIAEAMEEAGIVALDAPVSGGVAGAVAGTLAVMVSGPHNTHGHHRPMLEKIGKNVFYVGDKIGMGQLMKLLNNLLSGTALAVTSEAVALGIKAGIAPQMMIDVFNASSGLNTATEAKFPNAVLTRSFDIGFNTGLMFKACLSGLHPHPLGLEWAQTGYRGARHGCSRPRRSPIPAFATRVPATFPR